MAKKQILRKKLNQERLVFASCSKSIRMGKLNDYGELTCAEHRLPEVIDSGDSIFDEEYPPTS
jgi:hypothetical protein